MCLFYPDSSCLGFWDLFMAVALIVSCMTTPIGVAFPQTEESQYSWDIYMNTIDSLFLMDILIIFNTAYIIEEFTVVDNRKKIAKRYLTGWFAIDVIAILPFDMIMQGLEVNHLVKLTRISRLYKLVKLAKLVRLLKLFKTKNKFSKLLSNLLNTGVGF